jgi:glucose-6-phosphate 1-epimerase
LESALYLDKTDAAKEKESPAEAEILERWTDRVYPENVASVTIEDAKRVITIDKSNSATTVVWNPWTEGSKPIGDLAPEAWVNFLCVETANTGGDKITLPPNEAHTLQAEISVVGR